MYMNFAEFCRSREEIVTIVDTDTLISAEAYMVARACSHERDIASSGIHLFCSLKS